MKGRRKGERERNGGKEEDREEDVDGGERKNGLLAYRVAFKSYLVSSSM